MSNLPTDRNQNYMKEMWGTTKLITDYYSLPINDQNNEKKVISEVMYDKAPKHDLLKQTNLHEIIRNDEDYDDWEYGTEPIYGKKW